MFAVCKQDLFGMLSPIPSRPERATTLGSLGLPLLIPPPPRDGDGPYM